MSAESNSTTIQSPEEFRLIDVTLTSDRFPGAINLKNITIEINIFEDIRAPYLTGSLVILDDNQIYDTLSIQGTERIRISLSLGPSELEIEKHFVISRISNARKVNDYSSVIQMDIIEDIGYLNNLTKFSQLYDGTGEEIISKIIRDKIFRPIANVGDNRIGYETFIPSHQQLFRLLIPYITPYNAINLVLAKMTTDKGMPYYFYSTLVDDNLFLADLETILTRPAFNDTPFVFSQSQTNSRTENPTDIVQQSYSILKVEQPNVDDTLLLAQLGGIRSTYTNIDLTTGSILEYYSLITDTITLLKNNGIIPENDVTPIDERFIPDRSGNDSRNLTEYDTRHFDEVSGSTSPYDDGVNNWTLENPDHFALRVQKYQIEQLLLRNTQTITVPGFWFLTKNSRTSVGNQIFVNVFKNDPGVSSTSSTSQILDPKRSGNYVMVAKRHTFNVTEYRHFCTIDCVRLTHPEVVT